MGLSLSHGREMDVGEIGLLAEQLPPFEDGPIDLRAWFPVNVGDQRATGDAHDEPDAARADPDRANADSSAAQPRPLDIEIGSGKGTFLVQQAALTPGVDYIGIEWAKAFWRYAADRCRRHGLTNVKLLRAEAGFFIRNYVPDAAVRQVHIYFPDPWPKKRHHKRRLIQTPFLHELHRILIADGLVRIATDHSDYFAWMEEHVAGVSALFERLPFERPPSAGEGELVGTNFERKYRREGRPFHGMVLRKR